MEVVGIDNPLIDCLLSLQRMPSSNEYVRLDEYSWQGGGKVSTAFAALGRLGVKTGIIGVIGDDPFGRFCIKDFHRHMVDTSRLVIDKEGKTSISFVVVEKEKKSRSFMIKPGSKRVLTVDDLDEEYITSAKILHLAYLSEVTATAARMAKNKNMRVVIDADVYNGEFAENMHLLDVLIGSEFFYRSAFGDDPDMRKNLKSLQNNGPKLIVITLGEKGCVVLDGDRYFEMPAFTSLEIVDTCGAGDVFHGAFIFGMLKGWDSEKTARFASAAAAIKCTRIGGRAGLPDLKMTEEFLAEGTFDSSSLDERVKYYESALFNMSMPG
jgi:sulfofructose kinase